MKTKKELLAEIQRLKTSEGRAWKAVHRTQRVMAAATLFLGLITKDRKYKNETKI